jgi:MFS transporter, DHA1 family, inner membrane transport protein
VTTTATNEPREVDAASITLPLVAFTAAKTTANTALRWVGPFLPTLEKAFGVSIGTLTTIIGLAELAGLSTAAMGKSLDRGHQRRVFILGLWLISASALIALLGNVWWFAASFVLLILGVANATVAGHAWISARVPYEGRARAIGIFELSWALALLLGAPLIAIILGFVGWRGPFVAIAILTAASALLVARVVPRDVVTDGAPTTEPEITEPEITEPGTTQPGPTNSGRRSLLGTRAWRVLFSSALLAAAGMSVFVVSGAWLSERFGVSTGGLGLVAAGFGAVELIASGTTAIWADRLGKRRSVMVGLGILGVGIVITGIAGDSVWLAVLGLTVFLAGFEYGFVSSLSLVSEAAPAARGRALGWSNSIGTLARASGLAASGQLYDSFGIHGSLGLATFAGLVAAVLLPGRLKATKELEHLPS